MRALLVAGAVVLLLAGCVGRAEVPAATPAATTAHAFVVHGVGVAESLAPEELQDLGTLAASTGEPLQDVVAEHRGQEAFDVVADALYGDASTGAVMAWRDDGRAHVTFTHRPAAPVVDRLRGLPIDTVVEWGLPMTHEDVVDYAWTAFGALDRIDGIQPLSGGPSTSGDAVELRYALTGTPPSDAVLREAVAAATDGWQGRATAPIRFTVGDRSEVGAIQPD